MFWSGNYIAPRELNFLLKEENVSLIQVLEADDILQECKADNAAVIKYLTRPDILAELITLITEEPPRNVELAMQYRHANMACEVLTSHVSMLSDRLSLDEVQMNRLCDFLLKEPPLNPLLASYFSKTIEMLLVRNPKQDCYLYHIVCLRVLDFFRSRRDFLPNLLKHISTSAIADIFKYFIRLDQFSEIVLEWLDEHQFLDVLIQIICGSYVPEELDSSDRSGRSGDDVHNHDDSGSDAKNDTPNTDNAVPSDKGHSDTESVRWKRMCSARVSAAAAGNAAALLTDLVLTACAPDGSPAGPRVGSVLRRRLVVGGARALLQGAFTSPARARRDALVHATRAVRALLHLPNMPDVPDGTGTGAGTGTGTEEENADEQVDVELAVAPHLPLLHNALLKDPQHELDDELDGEKRPNDAEGEGEREGEGEGDTVDTDTTPRVVRAVRAVRTVRTVRAVGQARIEVAALLAQLARAARDEVCCTMLTLGTPGVLIDMFFEYPDNNFLHSEVSAFIRNALENPPYRTQYARHLVVECDMLTRFMDAFEHNETKRPSVEGGGGGVPRSAYMGHLICALRCIASALPAELELEPPLLERWAEFRDDKLTPLLQHHDTPLGGYHPPEIIYKLENIENILASNYGFGADMAATASMDELAVELNADYINELNMGGGSAVIESPDFIADGLGLGLDDVKMAVAKNNFLEMANQRFDDDMWDEAPEGDDIEEGEDGEEGDEREGEGGPLAQTSPWESSGGAGGAAGAGGGGGGGGGAMCEEGWASFGVDGVDAFPPDDDFAAWPPLPRRDTNEPSTGEIECGVRSLRLEAASPADDPSSVELANNLLTAMSAMSPDAIANIVNANMAPFVPDTVDETSDTRR